MKTSDLYPENYVTELADVHDAEWWDTKTGPMEIIDASVITDGWTVPRSVTGRPHRATPEISISGLIVIMLLWFAAGVALGYLLFT